MVTQTAGKVRTNQQGTLLFVAWFGMLLASALPAILWRELFSGSDEGRPPFLKRH